MKAFLAAGAAIIAMSVASVSLAAAPHKVLERLSGPDGRWDYVSVDTANHRLLLARGDSVTAFDLSAPGAKGAVLVTGVGGHAALAVDGGAEVLVTNGAANTVTFLDAKGAKLGSIPTGANPDAAIIEPKTGLALVMDHGGGDVALIDVKARKQVGSIVIGGALEAAAPDGAGRAYVNVEDKSQIAVIDVVARKVVARYQLSDCEGPTGIAYVPEGKRLIVACDGAVGVVSAATGKMLKTIKIGKGADGVAYDAVRKLAYVPSGREGALNVLAVTVNDVALLETIPTQVGARTLAADGASGKVYLPTATMGAAPPGGGRPAPEPGTFVVLVVGQ